MGRSEERPRNACPGRTSRLTLLLALGTAGAAASAIAAALTVATVPGEWRLWAPVARASLVAIPVGVGLYVWATARAVRFGRLLVAIGFAWFLTTLAQSDDATVYSIGRVAGWFAELGLVWLMLAFPSGRLAGTIDRVLVGVAIALVAFLYLPSALLVSEYPAPSPYTSCVDDCPPNAFDVLGSGKAVADDVLVPVRELITILLFVAVPLRLLGRLRHASRLTRRTLAPVLSIAVAQFVILAVGVAVRATIPDSPVVEVLTWGIALAVPALALAFLAGLVARRVHAAAALQRLALAVGARPTPETLRQAVRDAIEDPTLEIVYPVEGGSRWADDEGREVPVPPPGGQRCLTEIRSDDRVVAAVVHDAALREETDFVRAVGAYVLTALDNQRMSAGITGSLRRVEASRARTLAIADSERRQIERDLHDGAQQRLVALRIQLELAEDLLESDLDLGRTKLHALGAEVDAAIEEIRQLARGIYPSLLAAAGLAAALRSAALALPMDATVNGAGIGRFSAEIESAVYFCCLEAMQNASKHGDGAQKITITLTDEDGLRFAVHDDGCGFDQATTQSGTGLTNMRDRLAALGGVVEIESASGRGTTVRGCVPVARGTRASDLRRTAPEGSEP